MAVYAATVLVQQRVYFMVKSEELTAEQIAERVGMRPDRVMVRGSRQAAPAVPACHGWQVDTSVDRSVWLDEQIRLLIARVAPAAPRIGELVASGRAAASLVVVRSYRPGRPVSPIGFAIDIEAIRVLHQAAATVDFDEYDYVTDADADG
jgi:hypothetical protein